MKMSMSQKLRIVLISVVFMFFVMLSYWLALLIASPIIDIYPSIFSGFYSLVFVFILFLVTFIITFRGFALSDKMTLACGYEIIKLEEKHKIFFWLKKKENVNRPADYMPLSKSMAFLLIIYLVLIFVLASTERSYEKQKLEVLVKEMKEKGFPVELSLIKKDIKPENNLYPDIINISENIRIIEFRNEFKYKRGKFYSKWDKETARQYDLLISSFNEQIEKCVGLISNRDNFYTIDKDMTETQFMNRDLPKMGNLIALSDLIAYKAISAAKNNDANKTVLYLDSGIRLAKAISQEPSLISNMIALGIEKKVYMAIYAIYFNTGNLDYYEKVKKGLEELQKINFVNQGFKTEILFHRSWYKRFADKRLKLKDLLPFYEGNDWIFKILSLNGNLEKNYSYILNQFYNIEERMKDIKDPFALKKITEEDSSRSKNIPVWPYFVATSFDFTKLEPLYFRELERDVVSSFYGILYALDKYKKKNGKYPENLNALFPDYLRENQIIDIFSGKEFIYKKTKTEITIYSYGYNMKDDNGDINNQDAGLKFTPIIY